MDSNAAVNPASAEIPDDAIDQDCSGFDTVTCYVDNDEDGFGGSTPWSLSVDSDFVFRSTS